MKEENYWPVAIATPTKEVSTYVQQEAFKLGFHWGSDTDKVLAIKYISKPFLVLYKNKAMAYGSTSNGMNNYINIIEPEEIRELIFTKTSEQDYLEQTIN